MTPLPPYHVWLQRPCYNPDPKRWNLKLAISNREIQRCKLSDHVWISLRVAWTAGLVQVKQVDLFETDHTSMVKPGADLRKNHVHQGHPALAPDGRVISFEGRTFEGSDRKALEKGIIEFEDLPKCKGYDKWVREDVQGNDGDGGPYPDQEALDIMNAYRVPDLAAEVVDKVEEEKLVVESAARVPSKAQVGTCGICYGDEDRNPPLDFSAEKEHSTQWLWRRVKKALNFMR